VKCFLKIKHHFEKRECGFLLNKIFINDFIVWIQTVSDAAIAHMLNEILKVDISKGDLDLGLDQIDEFAID
jgi:hypothetical protein